MISQDFETRNSGCGCNSERNCQCQYQFNMNNNNNNCDNINMTRENMLHEIKCLQVAITELA